ncbi:MAG: SDR family oxidoreductase, partial [Polyangiaceae bacterium]
NLDKREALEKAAGERGVRVHVEQLDVTTEGVDAKVKELLLKYGPFQVLVNNAGIGIAGAFEEQSDRDVRDQFETNVFGLIAMTRAVLPSMRAARRGRIVNVSSISGRLAPPMVSIYAATKHAVEGFSEALRWEVEPFGVGVVLVEPGLIKTPIFFENMRRGEGMSPDSEYAAASAAVEKALLRDLDKALDPAVVGKTIARLVAEPSPPFRTPVGTDARVLLTLRKVLPEAVFSVAMRQAIRSRSGG